jgi:hypothetical protein
LSRKAVGVHLVSGGNPTISFGTLLIGDADNNDRVDLFDYNDVITWFGKAPNDTTENPDFGW